jgi:hypothetical protein
LFRDLLEKKVVTKTALITLPLRSCSYGEHIEAELRISVYKFLFHFLLSYD